MYIIYKENMRKYDKATSLYEWMKRGGLGFSLGAFMILSILTSCAKMGQPDGDGTTSCHHASSPRRQPKALRT